MSEAPSLTIRQARTISAVAAYASLARAAEHLNASQSTLSRYIAEAEAALGHILFQRGWTGMEPTSRGEIVIASCRRMMSSIETVQSELKAGGARVSELGHHLTWEMLDAVDAVRAKGSVSAAAEYLGQSQPNVSRILAKTSAAIGLKPFRRTRTGMAATKDATQLLSELRDRLLVDAMALPSRLQALSDEVTGRVAIGLLPFSEQAIVMQAFGDMMRRHRHVRLQAVTGAYAALVDGLRRDELDFVVGPLRHPPPFDTLTERRLFSESFAMVARQGHPLASAPDLAKLADANWVVAPHGTPTRRYFEELLIRQGLTPPAQTCEIVTFALAEQIILESDAVALLTYSGRKRKALREGLEILDIELPDSRRDIGLTLRKHHPLTTAQKAFVEILSERANEVR